jgi:signal transduction histidine kinase
MIPQKFNKTHLWKRTANGCPGARTGAAGKEAPYLSDQLISNEKKLRGTSVAERFLDDPNDDTFTEDVRLEERARIAQELHDTLLQTFQSASLHLGVALYGLAPDSPLTPKLDRILQIMRQGIEEGRNAIQGLRPTGFHTSDLVLSLSRVRDELEAQPDIDFRATVIGRQRQLPPEVQHEIYRIGREALVNAFCHAASTRIELELEYSDHALHVRIRDNGRGIPPQVLEKGRDGHWGLAGMRERAARIGGILEIQSSATAGTEVTLSVSTSIALEFSPARHIANRPKIRKERSRDHRLRSEVPSIRYSRCAAF